MFDNLPGIVKQDSTVPTGYLANVDRTKQETDAEAAAKIKRDNTPVWAGVGASAMLGSVGVIDRAMQEAGLDVDPAFRLPDNFTKDLEESGVAPENFELFERAQSQAHYDWLKGIARQNQMAKDDLAQFGLLANVGLGALDPGMFALDAVAAPLAATAATSRVGRTVVGGAVAAGENVGFDVAASRYDPELTGKHMLADATLGFALGGGAAFLTGHEAGALNDAARRARDTKVPDAVPHFDDSASAARVAGSAVETDIVPQLREESKEADWLARAQQNSDIKLAFANWRRDISARFGKMQSILSNDIGRRMVREGVGYTDKTRAIEESASEFAKRTHDVHITAYQRQANAAWSEFRKANGLSSWSAEDRSSFFERVGRAIRGADEADPHVLRVAKANREAFEEMRKVLRESRVAGFEELPSNPDYLPRKFSERGYARIFGELGLTHENVVEHVIAPAMRRAWKSALPDGEELDEELVNAVAGAWLNRAQQKATGLDLTLTHGLPLNDVEGIGELLRDAGVSNAKAAAIVGRLEAKRYQASAHEHARSRIDMDESYRAQVPLRDGRTVEVGVADLLENDAERLLHDYSREMSGWAAMAQKVDVKSPGELERMRKVLAAEARRAGDDPEETLRLFDLTTKSVLGKSTESNPGSGWSRAGRMMRDYNFLRVMGQVGYTMFAELGPTMAHAGFRSTLKAVPALAGLFRTAADGTLKSPVARMLERVCAPGTDWTRNPPFLRLEEGVAAHEQTSKYRLLNRLDNAAQVAKRAQTVVSGMAPAHAVMQRFAARAMLDKMIGQARKGTLGSAETARLRSWGLTDKMQSKVFDELRKAKRVEDINPDAWDFDTREAFSSFMYRTTRHLVVEGDVGDSLEFMHSALGKVLMQFRSFMTTSYTRHFLNSAHHLDDWRTWAMLTLSTGFAAAGYAGRAAINYANDPEKRERALAPEAIAKAGFAQSSFSSFIPSVVDSFGSYTGLYDPQFAFTRSTGLAQDAIMAVPTIDAAAKLTTGIRGVASAALSGDEFTRDEAEALGKLFWFNNVTGVRNILDSVYQQFPQARRK